jgi:hypothetical protein
MAPKKSEFAVNKLCQHQYEECSDLPRFINIGIFSCSACDLWRERIHNKGYCAKKEVRRDFLSERYQCRRPKLNMGPIKVRVVLKASSCPAPPNIPPKLPFHQSSVVAMKENIPVKLTSHQSNLASQKDRRALEIISRLEKSKRATEVEKVLKSRSTEMEEENKAKRKLEFLNNEIKVKEARLAASSKQLAEVSNKVKSQKALGRYYDSTARAVSSDMDEVYYLCESIERACNHLKGKHASTKAKLLMEAIKRGNLFKGEAATALSEFVRQRVRDLFRPWKLVKAGDVYSAGSFKTSTVNALRQVIDHEKESLFPSPTTVNRSRSLLDKYAADVIGYERKETPYGEVYFLNFEATLRLLLKASNLHDLAKTTSIKIALTVDGADLFSDRTHVSTGLKITDERGIHPVTKQPLLLVDNDADPTFIKVQSSELCAITIIADARDNKHLYEEVFNDFYEWGEKLRTEGLPESRFGPKLHPFSVTHNTDLKAAWYLSDRGGGCKNKTFFCHLCDCTKNTLVSYNVNELRCDRCKRRGKPKCYHHKVCDEVYVNAMVDDLEQQLGKYYDRHGRTYEEIMSKTKLGTDHMQATKHLDPNHIDYDVPQNDPDKIRQYTQFIAKECTIRKISTVGGQLEEWRALLRMSVTMEKYIFFLLNVRRWKEEGVEKVPLVKVVELLIPCILHLENRTGEKMITMILRKGMELFQGPKDRYIQAMEHAFQTKILGSDSSPSHWKLKYSKEAGRDYKIEPVQVKNRIARRILDNVDVLLEAAFSDQNEDFRSKVLETISWYREAMKLLLLHRELTEDEGERFQDLIDDFYSSWIDLFGEEGITNYIHMLGSGHMLYFIKKYSCMYLYSQQGWESLNNKIQTFIHQNTQRGGFGSGEGSGKSCIFPLVRYVLRDLLWKTYEADQFFLDLESKGILC